jgi:hypothetical protein
MVTLTHIPFSFDKNQLFNLLRIKHDSSRAKEFENLLDEVQTIGKPKALYKVSFIDSKGTNSVTIDGVQFTSIVLRKNLDVIERVFPYIVTCGTEIDEVNTVGNLQKKMWIAFLKGNLLQTSIQYLQAHITKQYRVSNLSHMNPGSGDASVWPIEQQKQLFSIFGDVEKLIGVKLTQSLVLAPDMSGSGILFPTETTFASCQLCHRENCFARRAPFDKELWESMKIENNV